ncbi:hypothetical protein ACI5QD_003323 [Salmonella enterica subsp. enterica serovar Falkensee]
MELHEKAIGTYIKKHHYNPLEA